MKPGLLKGSSPSVSGENMRMLKQSGLSEADAAAQVMAGEGAPAAKPKQRIVRFTGVLEDVADVGAEAAEGAGAESAEAELGVTDHDDDAVQPEEL